MLKPTSIEDLQTLADNATELVKIVRQWLPVSGDTETKTASWRTAERWFYSAAECYTVCERIRNPHKLPFGIVSGQYYGPSACSAAWFEIQAALDQIAVAYRLQGVSDESGCPHLPYGETVPAVDSGTLRRLEIAASAIIEAIRNETSAAESARNASDNPATAKPVADQTAVDAKRLADYAGIGDRTIRDALASCQRVADSTGRAPHQWHYSEAVKVLRKIQTGKLAGKFWPDSANELTTNKDSNKIPARK